jgi:hypothetical protein
MRHIEKPATLLYQPEVFELLNDYAEAHMKHCDATEAFDLLEFDDTVSENDERLTAAWLKVNSTEHESKVLLDRLVEAVERYR